MSKIILAMNVSVTEEFFDEFKKELGKKGSILVPFKTSEGVINLELTEVEQCQHTIRVGEDTLQCGKAAGHDSDINHGQWR